MVKKIAIGLAILAAALLGFAALQPDEVVIQRSETIQAPVAKVQALVHDFHAWEQWSPWDRLDPQMKRSYSGTMAGPGAIYQWQGNDEVGSGRMTITAVEPGKAVRINLEFTEPWQASNTTVFSFAESGSATRVTWIMTDSNRSFASKLAGLVMDMDAAVGKDFEAGLENLKAIAEKP